jgi:hypothetical protein
MKICSAFKVHNAKHNNCKNASRAAAYTTTGIQARGNGGIKGSEKGSSACGRPQTPTENKMDEGTPGDQGAYNATHNNCKHTSCNAAYGNLDEGENSKKIRRTTKQIWVLVFSSTYAYSYSLTSVRNMERPG